MVELFDNCPSSKETALEASVEVHASMQLDDETSVPVTIRPLGLSAGGLGRLSFKAKQGNDRVDIEYAEREHTWRPFLTARQTVGYVQAVLEYANNNLEVQAGIVSQKTSDDVATVLNS
jgi:hypothetical protein